MLFTEVAVAMEYPTLDPVEAVVVADERVVRVNRLDSLCLGALLLVLQPQTYLLIFNIIFVIN